MRQTQTDGASKSVGKRVLERIAQQFVRYECERDRLVNAQRDFHVADLQSYLILHLVKLMKIASKILQIATHMDTGKVFGAIESFLS